MASKYTPKEVSTDLDGLIAVMTKYPTFKVGDKVLKPDEKEWALADTKALKKSIDDDLAERESLERQLTTVNNRLQDTAKTGNEVITRGRSAVRGTFGADSDEYEQVGGTRTSERKPAVRSPKKPA